MRNCTSASTVTSSMLFPSTARNRGRLHIFTISKTFPIRKIWSSFLPFVSFRNLISRLDPNQCGKVRRVVSGRLMGCRDALWVHPPNPKMSSRSTSTRLIETQEAFLLSLQLSKPPSTSLLYLHSPFCVCLLTSTVFALQHHCSLCSPFTLLLRSAFTP